MIRDFESLKTMEAYLSSQINGDFTEMDMEVLSDYVKRLKKGDQYLEIGVKFGKSAATAVFSAPEGVVFYFCDIVDKVVDKPIFFNSLSRKDFFKQEKLDTVSTFILGDSKEVAKTWDKGKLKMIFIDGNHAEEAIKADTLGWTPYLESGGYILFHDYDEPTSPGVCKVVNELIRDSGNYTDFFRATEKYKLKSSMAGATKK